LSPELLIADLTVLFSVVVLDLVLAGDNAIVIGMAANRVAPHLRSRAIAAGIALATVLRITFAVVAVQLLTIVGLVLVGGLLLLWVAWKLWRDLHGSSDQEPDGVADTLSASALVAATVSFWASIYRIAIADATMSLDNVLAVAGAGREHPTIMAFGLLLSIALMGAAAVLISRLLDRYRWLNYAGLTIITVVALRMIYDGAGQVLAHTQVVMLP
jgi:YjbE family integral membrane protein